ncbi:uncharacterized protein A4U43_C07F14160 [Asparagus officinalis]|uniref:Uncharacterized protein n=1 Tax=Asparagus officinalis TaxID=4686 RepID=A0A5P1EBY1_ASPOF|nr:uncharacterized protein LOC109850691 [Asparagus officinalis]ONK63352.1 uncharacterized protein A4U43_C07F14160 [Asparagus officinalis]
MADHPRLLEMLNHSASQKIQCLGILKLSSTGMHTMCSLICLREPDLSSSDPNSRSLIATGNMAKVGREAFGMLEEYMTTKEKQKMGREAFDMLEEFMPTKEKQKRPSQSYAQFYTTQPKKNPVYTTQPKKSEAVIDSNQAAKIYGGALIVGYKSRPKPSRWAF